jgi:hypothetical protein
MKERDYHLHDGKSGAAITVRVVPRSGSNAISEILDDGTITVRLTAQAGDEQTNRALIAYLAEVLQVKPQQLEIVAGLSGKDKLVTITGLDKIVVHHLIMGQLG